MTVSLTRVRGKVKAFRPVTKNRVQLELEDQKGVFELFIDQSWVINNGNDISMAGYRDETGKFVALAYQNHSKEITGWNNGGIENDIAIKVCKSHVLGGIFFLVVGFLISLTVIGALVGIPMIAFAYFGFVRSGVKNYKKAKQDFEQNKIWRATCAEAKSLVSFSR